MVGLPAFLLVPLLLLGMFASLLPNWLLEAIVELCKGEIWNGSGWFRDEP